MIDPPEPLGLARRSLTAIGRFRGIAFAVLIALAVLSGFVRAAPPATVSAIAAEATQFRLTLTDGRVLRSPGLVGAKLLIETPTGPAKIRIVAVERGPDAKSGDVWLHTQEVEQPDGTAVNLCDPGPDGRRQGFPLATRMRADGGSENTAPEQIELVCSAGARAKCVRFGYRPWEAAETALYAACTRMVHAVYCGDSVATTKNGMTIDMYDDRRIQVPDTGPDLEFEAGWTPGGAVCVRHVRVRENISLDRAVAASPRLAGKTGDMCTEDAARALGATLFNRSRP